MSELDPDWPWSEYVDGGRVTFHGPPGGPYRSAQRTYVSDSGAYIREAIMLPGPPAPKPLPVDRVAGLVVKPMDAAMVFAWKLSKQGKTRVTITPAALLLLTRSRSFRMFAGEGPNGVLPPKCWSFCGIFLHVKTPPPAIPARAEFTCPECGSHRWGSSGTDDEGQPLNGHCNGYIKASGALLRACRFTWLRANDALYFR